MGDMLVAVHNKVPGGHGIPSAVAPVTFVIGHIRSKITGRTG
jgi:hypothetical protein